MNDQEKLAHASRTLGVEADLLLIDCNVGMVVSALLGTAVAVAYKNGMTAKCFIGMIEGMLDETVGVTFDGEEEP